MILFAQNSKKVKLTTFDSFNLAMHIIYLIEGYTYY
jgi:hypothetical protein